MRTIQALGIAAIVASAIVTPAAAQYDAFGDRNRGNWSPLGTVQFVGNGDAERVWNQFGGPAQRLRLTADRNGANCRSVSITFANGRTREVFSGQLREDRPTVVDLPGNERNLRSVNLRCRPMGRGTAIVSIAADIDPRDQRIWRESNFFRGRPGFGNDIVIPVATERFGQNGDRETIVPGIRGERVQAIGLKAVNGNALCRRVVARFANGERLVLIAARDRNDLREGRTVWFDLPGAQRNVDSLTMTCAPAGRARNVTIQVLAERDTPRFPRGNSR